ncbi:DnaD domain-containing protein [Salinibacillus xinjiangensis]|uniref:DnaD domain-containing protein n=1 Tax=Salinibacillus xinjiangensis TaxID=1229268 RepID=UPI00189131AD|nr:DnaD domain protein [Salinibacillus xinjiangensis]
MNVDLKEEKETLKETVNRRQDGQNPFTIFEQNLGQLSLIAREKLMQWCAEMGDEMVVAAINLAIRNGGKTFNYIDKILLEWSRAKIETLEQLKTHEKNREQRKQTHDLFFTSRFEKRAV